MYLGSKPHELYVWKISEFLLLLTKLYRVHLMVSKLKGIN